MGIRVTRPWLLPHGGRTRHGAEPVSISRENLLIGHKIMYIEHEKSISLRMFTEIVT